MNLFMPNSNTGSSESITNYILNRLSIILTGIFITTSAHTQQICHDIYPHSKKSNQFLTEFENQLAQDLKYGNIAEAVQLISVTGERAKQFTLSVGKDLTKSNENSINHHDKVVTIDEQLLKASDLVSSLAKLLSSPKGGIFLRGVTGYDRQVVELLKNITAQKKKAQDFENALTERALDLDNIHNHLLSLQQQLNTEIIAVNEWKNLLDQVLTDPRLTKDQLKEVSRIRSILLTSIETMIHQKKMTDDSIDHNRDAKDRNLQITAKASQFLHTVISECIKSYRPELLEVANRSKKQMIEVIISHYFDRIYYGAEPIKLYQGAHINVIEFPFVKKKNDKEIVFQEYGHRISYPSEFLVVRMKFGESLIKDVDAGDIGYYGVVTAKMDYKNTLVSQLPSNSTYKYELFSGKSQMHLTRVSEALKLYLSQAFNLDKKTYSQSKVFLTQLLTYSPKDYLELISFLGDKTKGQKLEDISWKPSTGNQPKPKGYLPIKEIHLLLQAINIIESHRSDFNALDKLELDKDIRETVAFVLKLKNKINKLNEQDLNEREKQNDIFHLFI